MRRGSGESVTLSFAPSSGSLDSLATARGSDSGEALANAAIEEESTNSLGRVSSIRGRNNAHPLHGPRWGSQSSDALATYGRRDSYEEHAMHVRWVNNDMALNAVTRTSSGRESSSHAPGQVRARARRTGNSVLAHRRNVSLGNSPGSGRSLGGSSKRSKRHVWLLGDDRELMERLVTALGPWEIEPGQNCMYQYSVHTDADSLPWDTESARVILLCFPTHAVDHYVRSGYFWLPAVQRRSRAPCFLVGLGGGSVTDAMTEIAFRAGQAREIDSRFPAFFQCDPDCYVTVAGLYISIVVGIRAAARHRKMDLDRDSLHKRSSLRYEKENSVHKQALESTEVILLTAKEHQAPAKQSGLSAVKARVTSQRRRSKSPLDKRKGGPARISTDTIAVQSLSYQTLIEVMAGEDNAEGSAIAGGATVEMFDHDVKEVSIVESLNAVLRRVMTMRAGKTKPVNTAELGLDHHREKSSLAGATRPPVKRTFSHHFLGGADASARKQTAAQQYTKSGELLHQGGIVLHDSGVQEQVQGSGNKKEAGMMQGARSPPKRSATRRALDRFIACF